LVAIDTALQLGPSRGFRLKDWWWHRIKEMQILTLSWIKTSHPRFVRTSHQFQGGSVYTRPCCSWLSPE